MTEEPFDARDYVLSQPQSDAYYPYIPRTDGIPVWVQSDGGLSLGQKPTPFTADEMKAVMDTWHWRFVKWTSDPNTTLLGESEDDFDPREYMLADPAPKSPEQLFEIHGYTSVPGGSYNKFWPVKDGFFLNVGGSHQPAHGSVWTWAAVTYANDNEVYFGTYTVPVAEFEQWLDKADKVIPSVAAVANAAQDVISAEGFADMQAAWEAAFPYTPDVVESEEPFDAREYFLSKSTVQFCQNCGQNFREPNSVYRVYAPKNEELASAACEGHYAETGEFEPDESVVDLTDYDLLDDSDKCSACGVSTLTGKGTVQESAEAFDAREYFFRGTFDASLEQMGFRKANSNLESYRCWLYKGGQNTGDRSREYTISVDDTDPDKSYVAVSCWREIDYELGLSSEFVNKWNLLDYITALNLALERVENPNSLTVQKTMKALKADFPRNNVRENEEGFDAREYFFGPPVAAVLKQHGFEQERPQPNLRSPRWFYQGGRDGSYRQHYTVSVKDDRPEDDSVSVMAWRTNNPDCHSELVNRSDLAVFLTRLKDLLDNTYADSAEAMKLIKDSGSAEAIKQAKALYRRNNVRENEESADESPRDFFLRTVDPVGFMRRMHYEVGSDSYYKEAKVSGVDMRISVKILGVGVQDWKDADAESVFNMEVQGRRADKWKTLCYINDFKLDDLESKLQDIEALVFKPDWVNSLKWLLESEGEEEPFDAREYLLGPGRSDEYDLRTFITELPARMGTVTMASDGMYDLEVRRQDGTSKLFGPFRRDQIRLFNREWAGFRNACWSAGPDVVDRDKLFSIFDSEDFDARDYLLSGPSDYVVKWTYGPPKSGRQFFRHTRINDATSEQDALKQWAIKEKRWKRDWPERNKPTVVSVVRAASQDRPVQESEDFDAAEYLSTLPKTEMDVLRSHGYTEDYPPRWHRDWPLSDGFFVSITAQPELAKVLVYVDILDHADSGGLFLGFYDVDYDKLDAQMAVLEKAVAPLQQFAATLPPDLFAEGGSVDKKLQEVWAQHAPPSRMFVESEEPFDARAYLTAYDEDAVLRGMGFTRTPRQGHGREWERIQGNIRIQVCDYGYPQDDAWFVLGFVSDTPDNPPDANTLWVRKEIKAYYPDRNHVLKKLVDEVCADCRSLLESTEEPTADAFDPREYFLDDFKVYFMLNGKRESWNFVEEPRKEIELYGGAATLRLNHLAALPQPRWKIDWKVEVYVNVPWRGSFNKALVERTTGTERLVPQRIEQVLTFAEKWHEQNKWGLKLYQEMRDIHDNHANEWHEFSDTHESGLPTAYDKQTEETYRAWSQLMLQFYTEKGLTRPVQESEDFDARDYFLSDNKSQMVVDRLKALGYEQVSFHVLTDQNATLTMNDPHPVYTHDEDGEDEGICASQRSATRSSVKEVMGDILGSSVSVYDFSGDTGFDYFYQIQDLQYVSDRGCYESEEAFDPREYLISGNKGQMVVDRLKGLGYKHVRLYVLSDRNATLKMNEPNPVYVRDDEDGDLGGISRNQACATRNRVREIVHAAFGTSTSVYDYSVKGGASDYLFKLLDAEHDCISGCYEAVDNFDPREYVLGMLSDEGEWRVAWTDNEGRYHFTKSLDSPEKAMRYAYTNSLWNRAEDVKVERKTGEAEEAEWKEFPVSRDYELIDPDTGNVLIREALVVESEDQDFSAREYLLAAHADDEREQAFADWLVDIGFEATGNNTFELDQWGTRYNIQRNKNGKYRYAIYDESGHKIRGEIAPSKEHLIDQLQQHLGIKLRQESEEPFDPRAYLLSKTTDDAVLQWLMRSGFKEVGYPGGVPPKFYTVWEKTIGPYQIAAYRGVHDEKLGSRRWWLEIWDHGRHNGNMGAYWSAENFLPRVQAQVRMKTDWAEHEQSTAANG